jgi:colicin import membrane protein
MRSARDEHTDGCRSWRGDPRRTASIALTIAVCAGAVVGCGSSGHGTSQAGGEPTPGVPGGSEQAREATAARQRADQLKQSETAEEAQLKQMVEAVKRAQAQAAAAAQKRKSEAEAKKRSAHSNSTKQHTAKPKRTAKPTSPAGESPAEKTAREQFAKEEAQEQAAYKKHEREEAAEH